MLSVNIWSGPTPDFCWFLVRKGLYQGPLQKYQQTFLTRIKSVYPEQLDFEILLEPGKELSSSPSDKSRFYVVFNDTFPIKFLFGNKKQKNILI